jgi:hypothetical protein
VKKSARALCEYAPPPMKIGHSHSLKPPANTIASCLQSSLPRANAQGRAFMIPVTIDSTRFLSFFQSRRAICQSLFTFRQKSAADKRGVGSVENGVGMVYNGVNPWE